MRILLKFFGQNYDSDRTFAHTRNAPRIEHQEEDIEQTVISF